MNDTQQKKIIKEKEQKELFKAANQSSWGKWQIFQFRKKEKEIARAKKRIEKNNVFVCVCFFFIVVFNWFTIVYEPFPTLYYVQFIYNSFKH